MLISKDWVKRLTELKIDDVICCLYKFQEGESVYNELINSNISVLSAIYPSAQVLGGEEDAHSIIYHFICSQMRNFGKK